MRAHNRSLSRQELIIRHRKKRGCPLDLTSHIHQYVRTYNSPVVPQIKIEPSNYLDVNLGLDQEDELDGLDNEEEFGNEEEEFDDEDEDEEEGEDDDDDDDEDYKPGSDLISGSYDEFL